MKWLVTILAAVLLSGCMALKQERVTGGEGFDHFGFFDRQGFGLLNVGPSNVPKTIHLLDAESFAIGPKGERYPVRSEPHSFDVEKGFPYVRDRVYLLKAGGERLKVRDDGQWKFVFLFENTTGK